MLFKKLFQQYLRHLKRFNDDFDSIKDICIENENNESVLSKISELPNKPKTKLHFFIGMLTILYVGFDSAWIIYKESILHNRNWTAISHIEMLFPHRIFPHTFWYQADIAAFLCLSMAVIFLLFFAFYHQ